MKVLGCKVPDWFYDKFKELDGTISQHVYKACKLYLESQVNLSKTQVNHDISDDKYKYVRSEIDALQQQKKHGDK
jgi:hypothetical protein